MCNRGGALVVENEITGRAFVTPSLDCGAILDEQNIRNK